MRNESEDNTNLVSDGQAEVAEFEALSSVIQVMRGLPPEARQRVLGAVSTFLGIAPMTRASLPQSAALRTPGHGDSVSRFSEDRTPSPKEFLLEKRPSTDVDRVASLAYYLTHYREMPHFKTLDLSKLNTEAAQPKFSNAAAAVDNATRAGLLVPALKGAKQLSALGELYVQALPDRTAARATIVHARPKRKSRRISRGVPQLRDDGDDSEQ